MKKSNNKEIDISVKKSFGKFYIYSIVFIMILIIYPFIMNRVKWWFNIILLLFFIIFYLIMVRDLIKKKGNYWTTTTSVLIFFVIVILTLDIIKLGLFLIK